MKKIGWTFGIDTFRRKCLKFFSDILGKYFKNFEELFGEVQLLKLKAWNISGEISTFDTGKVNVKYKLDFSNGASIFEGSRELEI